MKNLVNNNGISTWLVLAIAVIFLILGIGIISGLVLPNNSFLGGGTRLLIGSILTLYGLARGIMILSSMSPAGNTFSVVDFILTILALVFFFFGVAIMAGLIFGSERNISGVNRSILGGALALYGIWQGIRIVRKLKTAFSLNEEG